MPHLFEGRKVTVIRSNHLVLRAVDFTLERGELMLLRGVNGSGKTTLLKVMAGVLRPTFGACLWQGEDIGDSIETHFARVNYIAHQNGVKDALTLLQNAEFWAALYGKSRQAGIEALAFLGLGGLEAMPTGWLSQGQKRRLGLVRLILKPGRLWLLDEPFAGLDAQTCEWLEEKVLAHINKGGSAILATHGHGFHTQGFVDQARNFTLTPPRASDTAATRFQTDELGAGVKR